VVERFTAKAPLVVEKKRYAQIFFEYPAGQRPLVQVGMDQVRPEIAGHGQGFDDQQQVEIRFVPGWPGPLLAVPGDLGCPLNRYRRQVAAKVIGDDPHLMAPLHKSTGLFKDPHMATPVGKIGGGGEHQDSQRGKI